MAITTESTSTPSGSGEEARANLLLERTFDAPRDLVWLAWTKPGMAVRWFGPNEWPAIEVKQDLRVGGAWSARLKSCCGDQILWQGGVYRRIERPSALEFTFAWGEGHEDGDPVETLVTILLDELPGGRTLMRFRQTGLKSRSSAAGHQYGWNSAFARLAAELARGDLIRDADRPAGHA